VLESIFLQLESIGLQHLLEPFFDTQYFGCPDDCIVQGSEEHNIINFVFSPLLYVIIIIGVGTGLLVKYARRLKQIKSERKTSYVEKIKEFDRKIDNKWHGYGIQQQKQTKLEKKKYLEQVTNEPQKAYLDWVSWL